jgi:hypothetical protein
VPGVGHEYPDLVTTIASKAVDFACGRHFGHLGDVAEDATQATHVSRQLLRSGTAAAANYGEARGAESRSDFVHKLGLCSKNSLSPYVRLHQCSRDAEPSRGNS